MVEAGGIEPRPKISGHGHYTLSPQIGARPPIAHGQAAGKPADLSFGLPPNR